MFNVDEHEIPPYEFSCKGAEHKIDAIELTEALNSLTGITSPALLAEKLKEKFKIEVSSAIQCLALLDDMVLYLKKYEEVIKNLLSRLLSSTTTTESDPTSGTASANVSNAA